MKLFTKRIHIITSPRVKPQMNCFEGEGSGNRSNDKNYEIKNEQLRVSGSLQTSLRGRIFNNEEEKDEDDIKNSNKLRRYHSYSSTVSSSTSTIASTSRRKCKSDVGVDRHVSFSKIYVREYERVLGDNPSVTSGAPIGIGWKHAPEEVYDVEGFEWTRTSNRFRSSYHHEVERLSPLDREQMLRDIWNISPSLIRQASVDARKTKEERLKSYCESQRFSRMKNIFAKFGARHHKATIQTGNITSEP